MFVKIRKRDGREAPFNAEKIAGAINKALVEVGDSTDISLSLTEKVVHQMEADLAGRIPEVEEIQDIVE